MKLLYNGAGGFIRCELNEHTRFHVYHPDFSPTVSVGAGDMHDHRFTMTSRVLFGALNHYVYNVEVDEHGGHMMYHVIDDKFHFVDYVSVDCIDLITHEQGKDFQFGGPNWFHRVVPKGLTITSVTRTADVSDGEPAKVLANRNHEPENAFDPATAPTDGQMAMAVRGAFEAAMMRTPKV